jgi:hypothetical protein
MADADPYRMRPGDSTTRLELVRAFGGDGVPDKKIPPMDKNEAAAYFGELAREFLEALPRSMRRNRRDTEVALDLCVRMLTFGFWGGVTWMVERDAES